MSNSSASSHGTSGGVAVTPSMSASAIVANTTGTRSHVLKIDGYSRTKGLSVGKFIMSRLFQVGGRRWCLRYYPDSHYNTTVYDNCISIILCLDPSEATKSGQSTRSACLTKKATQCPATSGKSILCWTFSGKREPPVSELFITKAELENSLYLKDDAFSVRCDITVVMEIVTEDLVVPVVEPACCSVARQ
ncbi:hypothetical protein VPH35_030808 [Triticum aestivum]